MRPILIMAAAVLLAACGRDRSDVQADLPPSCPASAGASVEFIERKIYVPIPSSLTRREDIAEGALNECPQVARDRRAAIERLNSRMQQIEAQQGTEVQP
ncbi:hypothetical protein CMZ84_04260 [Lysobacteraceae bacterium NML93-0399]|nr:hypothetical protein CMZ84_04260 [Xanthomonadaceae bacterium NML93-0399]